MCVCGLVFRWMGGYVDRWVDTCSVRATFMTTFFSSCYQFNILLCLYLILFIYSPVPTPSSPILRNLHNLPPSPLGAFYSTPTPPPHPPPTIRHRRADLKISVP